jgi:hypothetical protein
LAAKGGTSGDGQGGTGGATGVGGTELGGSGGGALEPHVARTTSVFVHPLRSLDGYPTLQCLPSDFAAGDGAEPELQVYFVSAGGSCGACDPPGFAPVTAGVRSTIQEALGNAGVCGSDCEDYCVCEELPGTEDELSTCQNVLEEPMQSGGWCFLSKSRAIGNPDLLRNCTGDSPAALRIVAGQSGESSLFVVVASQVTEQELTLPERHLPVGSTCIPEMEWSPTFGGFALTEGVVNLNDAACDSSICLANHYQGRVSCPYGQTQAAVDAENFGCFVPNSDEPIRLPVDSQRVALPARWLAACSCRCDGPGPGPYCACPSGMECAPMVPDIPLTSLQEIVGSYCVAAGTEYAPTRVISAETCESERNQHPPSCEAPPPY